jgi:hypothetical protein
MVTIVTMPTCPVPTGVDYTLISYGTDMTGPLGGPTQRVLNVGDRYSVAYSFPPMAATDAMKFIARLTAGRTNPIAMVFPQRGFDPVYPGPIVAAAGGSGGLLPVTGGIDNFLLNEGQFFSIQSGGRRWIHQIQNDTQLAADGSGTLPINPLMRFSPAVGDALTFINPVMEGFAELSVKFSLKYIVNYGIQFTITEDR